MIADIIINIYDDADDNRYAYIIIHVASNTISHHQAWHSWMVIIKDGWMNGYMDGYMDGWINGWMYGWIYGWI